VFVLLAAPLAVQAQGYGSRGRESHGGYGERGGYGGPPANAARGGRPGGYGPGGYGPAAENRGPAYRGPTPNGYPGPGAAPYPGERRLPPSPYGEPRGWARGQYMPPQARGEMIADYARYHLRRPPRGYYWYRSGEDFVLASVSTGVIFEVIPGDGW
jgi:Ni/Co efflux regulator RcnB